MAGDDILNDFKNKKPLSVSQPKQTDDILNDFSGLKKKEPSEPVSPDSSAPVNLTASDPSASPSPAGTLSLQDRSVNTEPSLPLKAEQPTPAPAVSPAEPPQAAAPESGGVESDYYIGGEFGGALRAMDATTNLGIGKMIDGVARSIASGQTQNEAVDESLSLLANPKGRSDKDIEDYINAVKVSQSMPPSPAMREYQRVYKEEGEDAWAFVKALAKNPGVAPEVMISSLSSMMNAPSLAAAGSVVGTAAVGGAILGEGVGAIPAAIASLPYAMAAAGTVLEATTSFTEFMQDELSKQGKDFTKENVKAILEDDALMNKIRAKAAARGIVIGVVDAVGSKIAGDVGSSFVKKAMPIRGTLAAAGIDAASGSGGEAAARAITGQKMDASEIGLEGVGELVQTPIDILSSAKSSDFRARIKEVDDRKVAEQTVSKAMGKPSYHINGEEVSKEAMVDIVKSSGLQELKDIKFNVFNDEQTSEFINDRMNDLIMQSHVEKANPDLAPEAVEQVKELEKEVAALKDNPTESAKVKVSKAKMKIKKIVKQDPQAQPTEPTPTAPTESTTPDVANQSSQAAPDRVATEPKSNTLTEQEAFVVKIGGTPFLVNSLKEASEKTLQSIESANIGGGDYYNKLGKIEVFTKDGQKVGTVSYNGKVFADHPDGGINIGELLYSPYSEQTTTIPVTDISFESPTPTPYDPTRSQELRNSIAEGELMVKAKKSNGRKLSKDELQSISDQVAREKARLAEMEANNPNRTEPVQDVSKIQDTEQPEPAPIFTEREFSKKYIGQHKDLRSKTEEEKTALAKVISENGFKKSMNTNTLPLFKGMPKDRMPNVTEKAFGNMAGDMVYILKKGDYVEGGNGWKVKEGYKPTQYEHFLIEYDGQPTYEAYLHNAERLNAKPEPARATEGEVGIVRKNADKERNDVNDKLGVRIGVNLKDKSTGQVVKVWDIQDNGLVNIEGDLTGIIDLLDNDKGRFEITKENPKPKEKSFKNKTAEEVTIDDVKNHYWDEKVLPKDVNIGDIIHNESGNIGRVVKKTSNKVTILDYTTGEKVDISDKIFRLPETTELAIKSEIHNTKPQSEGSSSEVSTTQTPTTDGKERRQKGREEVLVTEPDKASQSGVEQSAPDVSAMPVVHTTTDGITIRNDRGELVMYDANGVQIPQVDKMVPMKSGSVELKYRSGPNKGKVRMKKVYNKRYTQTKQEYLNSIEFDNGRNAPEPTERLNEEQYTQHIIETTQNPQELIGLYEAEKEMFESQRIGTKDWYIAQALGDVTRESFNRHMDRNMYKDREDGVIERSYFNKNGSTLDEVAQGASMQMANNPDVTDLITPQDVGEFIVNHPSGVKEFYEAKSGTMRDIEQAFHQLTGLPLDDQVRQIARNQMNARQAPTPSERVKMQSVTPEIITELNNNVTLETLPLYKDMLTGEEYSIVEKALTYEQAIKNGVDVGPEETGSGTQGTGSVGPVKAGPLETAVADRIRYIDAELPRLRRQLEDEKVAVDKTNANIELPLEREGEMLGADGNATKGSIPDITRKIADLESERSTLDAKLEQARKEDQAQGDLFESAKSLADKIRSYKVDPGLNDPIAFGFSDRQLWNDILDFIATGIENGGRIADMVQKGVEYFKNSDLYRSLTDKDRLDHIRAIEGIGERIGASESDVVKERKFFTSIQNADNISQETKDLLKNDPANRLYVVKKNALSIQQAKDYVDEFGLEQTIKDLSNPDVDMLPSNRNFIAMEAMRQSDAKALELKNTGELQASDEWFEKATTVAEDLISRGTELGRAVQSMATLGSPERIVYNVRKAIKKKRAELKEANKEDIDNKKANTKKKITEAVDETLSDPGVKSKIAKARRKPSNPTDPAESLAKRIIGRLSDNPKKFDPVREMVNVLFGKVDENLTPKDRTKEPAIAKLKRVLENKAEYAETWENAKTEVQRIMVDKGFAPEQIEEYTRQLEAFYNEVIGSPYNERMVDAVTGEAINSANVNLEDLIRKHYTVYDATKRKLVDKLIEDAGVVGEDAKLLAEAVERSFDRSARKRIQTVIDRMLQRGTRKPNKRKSATEELIDMVNMGAFSDEQFLNWYADTHDWVNVTPEKLAELHDLANKVQTAKDGFQKYRATEDLMKFQRKMEGVTWGEVAQSYWYASVLSGVPTHIVNFVANVMNTAQIMANATVSNPKQMPAMLMGFAKGLEQGWYNAGDVLATGYAPVKAGKLDFPNTLEIKQFKGGNANPMNWAKFVTRAMMASDMLSYSSNKTMREYQLARMQAKKEGIKSPSLADIQDRLFDTRRRIEEAQEQAESEGLKGRDFKRRVFEIVEQSRPVEMVDDAATFASRATFNYAPEGTLGVLTDAMNNFTNKLDIGGFKPAKLLIPFTNIIANVANNTIDYTPYGMVRAMKGGMGWRGMGKGKWREFTREERKDALIKVVTGTMAMAALYALTEPDDKGESAIEITASGTGDFKKNYELKQTGWKEYSIRIGDHWYSYQYSPLALALAPIGFLRDRQKYRKETIEDPGVAAVFASTVYSTVRMMLDMTAVSSLNSVVQALSSDNPETGIDKLKSSATTIGKSFFVPNLYTQAKKQYDELFDIPAKEANTVIEKMYRDVPIARNRLFDKINALGDPVVLQTDRLETSVKNEPVWEFIVKHNAYIGTPRKESVIIEYPNPRIPTDEEYYNFIKTRGSMIKSGIIELMDAVKNNRDEIVSMIMDGDVDGIPVVNDKNKANRIIDEVFIPKEIESIKSQATTIAKGIIFGDSQVTKTNAKINSILNKKN